MTGQSNRSLTNVPEMECSWGQDEHPLVKGAREGVDESAGGLESILIQAEGQKEGQEHSFDVGKGTSKSSNQWEDDHMVSSHQEA